MQVLITWNSGSTYFTKINFYTVLGCNNKDKKNIFRPKLTELWYLELYKLLACSGTNRGQTLLEMCNKSFIPINTELIVVFEINCNAMFAIVFKDDTIFMWIVCYCIIRWNSFRIKINLCVRWKEIHISDVDSLIKQSRNHLLIRSES